MTVTTNTTINTVYQAFDEFSKQYVDLDSDEVITARGSRKWLVDQIEGFQDNVDGFPKIYTEENDVPMGSFSRRTKIRPLDDIDFLVVFSAEHSTYGKSLFEDFIRITVPTSATKLRALCDGDYLNSRKVINKLVSALGDVPQYSKAEIHRNQEAATLKLSSYPWNFDIVPAFLTAQESDGRNYYLIPDGNGNWKKTDPRIDSKRATDINQKHNGKVLRLVRLIKYWNKRPTMPTISSYLLENIALNYFDSLSDVGTIQSSLKGFFAHLSSSIYSSCMDPKGIQGDLNQLNYETKKKVSDAALKAYGHADAAINHSINSEHKKAIVEWQSVFGDSFPSFGQEVK